METTAMVPATPRRLLRLRLLSPLSRMLEGMDHYRCL
jgi:hypothetical protein